MKDPLNRFMVIYFLTALICAIIAATVIEIVITNNPNGVSDMSTWSILIVAGIVIVAYSYYRFWLEERYDLCNKHILVRYSGLAASAVGFIIGWVASFSFFPLALPLQALLGVYL